ncbi:MAG: hypothetical protein LBR07_02545 [Puniceicoccales bacterium]|nr:hypothetical protein [Puniceicoccales bacterium]
MYLYTGRESGERLQIAFRQWLRGDVVLMSKETSVVVKLETQETEGFRTMPRRIAENGVEKSVAVSDAR